MPDVTTALDAYLTHRFGITLERVLADASAGVVSLALAHSVEIVCDLVGRHTYDDGGLSELYQGLLTVEGVTYRFRASVFTDAGGASYVETVGAREVLSWGARLAVSGEVR